MFILLLFISSYPWFQDSLMTLQDGKHHILCLLLFIILDLNRQTKRMLEAVSAFIKIKY